MRSIRDLLGRAQRGLRSPDATVETAYLWCVQRLDEGGRRVLRRSCSFLYRLAEARGAKPMASVHFDLPQPPRSSRQLDLATAYIHRHLFEELTLSATASQAHMGPTGFSLVLSQVDGPYFRGLRN